MAWETIVASFAPMVLDAIGGLFGSQPRKPLPVPGGGSAWSDLHQGALQEEQAPWSKTLLGRSALALASPLWDPETWASDGAGDYSGIATGPAPGGGSYPSPQAGWDMYGSQGSARSQAAANPTDWTHRIRPPGAW